MNVYIVIAEPPASALAEAVKTKYGESCQTIVPDTAWAIGTPEESSADVCATLDIRVGDGQLLTGVVAKVENYYGVYDPALWQKISAWEKK